jgi:hypothetical protein
VADGGETSSIAERRLTTSALGRPSRAEFRLPHFKSVD